MRIEEIRKALNTRKELNVEADYYYFLGTGLPLQKIEENLHNCRFAFSIKREVLVKGHERVSFKLLEECPICHKTPKIAPIPECGYIIKCNTNGCPMNCFSNKDMISQSRPLSMAEYPGWLKCNWEVDEVCRKWNYIVYGVREIMRKGG